jgi:hypothetical protein
VILLKFVKFVILKLGIYMDWNSATTKKHIKEAAAVGLTLIGVGRNKACRTFRFNKCGHEEQIDLSGVRRDCFRCGQCFQIKLKKEAKDVGLTLIGEGRNKIYRTYRFNDCKHEKEIEPKKVRNNQFRCNQCLQIKLKKEAKDIGLTLIGEGSKAGYKTYRFNECRHEQEIKTSHVRNNQFRCNQCLQIKLKKEAKDVGLTLIGEGRNKIYRTYRFNECRHEQEIGIDKVRNNKFRCNQCLQIKLKKEAKDVGLTLIGEGSKARYKTYRFNECRHEQEIRADGVRNNNFLCNICEETSRDLPSKVYLLKIQSGSFIWLKLGYAKQISFRIKRYKLPEDAKVRRLKVIDFDTGREAHRYESSLHKKYIRKRLPIKKMKKYHKDGFNECYPLEMLDKLLEELESG